MSRSRVDGQPAYVLHSYPFRETSLIVEVFSRDHGRVALLARGARRPRSVLRGLLLAFQPLELGWAGKGEVPTLMKAEWQGGQPLLSGKALFFGYYLNELLLHLLPREDTHASLFAAYAAVLRRFADDLQEADLRRFERALLQELGYGLTLTHDAQVAALRVPRGTRRSRLHAVPRRRRRDRLTCARWSSIPTLIMLTKSSAVRCVWHAPETRRSRCAAKPCLTLPTMPCPTRRHRLRPSR